MARALFRDSLTDRKGNALSNITVTVYDEGTTTPISDTIYSTRTGVTTKTNPFTATNGEVEFWLDVDTERVDVKYSSARITTKTVTLDGISPDDLGGGGGGVTDHGALTGLNDDDHPQYSTAAEAQALVDTHAVDATGVHGIADTSALETTTGSQDKVDTHAADTTGIHGITDTSLLATDAEVSTAVSVHEAASDPHTGYQRESEKNTANGYAGLLSNSGLRIAGPLEQGYIDKEDISGAVTFNLDDGNVQKGRLIGNITPTISGATPGEACSLTLIFEQDGTGNRTAAWPASIKFPGGTDPVLTTTGGAFDTLTFFTVDGGTTWFGYLIGAGMA